MKFQVNCQDTLSMLTFTSGNYSFFVIYILYYYYHIIIIIIIFVFFFILIYSFPLVAIKSFLIISFRITHYFTSHYLALSLQIISHYLSLFIFFICDCVVEASNCNLIIASILSQLPNLFQLL